MAVLVRVGSRFRQVRIIGLDQSEILHEGGNESLPSFPSLCLLAATLFSEIAELQVPCEYLALVLSLWLSPQWEISHFQRGCSGCSDSSPEGHHLRVTWGNNPGYVTQ